MEGIEFVSSLENVSEADLQGFFIGWQKSLPSAKHLELLRNSDYVVLALNSQNKKVVGFITATV